MKALIAWLTECQVELVILESTGIYWKSVFASLSAAGIPAWVVSGKSDPLPGHPPLRTVLASFPAHGSSLDKPFLGASIITVFWIMDLSMAG